MSDVQAAAERVRRVHGGELLNSVYHDPQYPEATNYHLGYKGDTQEIVQAYLAEHPADDAEPIDEEWLRSVGFDEKRGGIGWQGPVTPLVWEYFQYSWWEAPKSMVLHFGGHWPSIQIETRGHLRRLCAALNIPLKQ